MSYVFLSFQFISGFGISVETKSLKSYPSCVKSFLPSPFVRDTNNGIGFAVNLFISNSFMNSFLIQIYICFLLCFLVNHGKWGIRSKCVFGGKTRCPRLDEPLIKSSGHFCPLNTRQTKMYPLFNTRLRCYKFRWSKIASQSCVIINQSILAKMALSLAFLRSLRFGASFQSCAPVL